MSPLDLSKPLPGHSSIDGLIAEYANYTPSYVTKSGSRWRLFFECLCPASKGDADGATIPIKGGSAN